MTQPDPTVIALKARQLEEVHRLAQERLGVRAAWQSYSAYAATGVQTIESADDSTFSVLVMVKALRKISARLARRYYNLTRAIQTGFAVRDPDQDWAESIPLGQLYEELAAVLNEVLEVTSARDPDLPDPAEAPPRTTTTDAHEDEAVDNEAALDALADIITDAFADLIPDEDSEEWSQVIAVDEDIDWPEIEDVTEEAEIQLSREVREIERQVKNVLKQSDKPALEVIAEAQDRIEKRSAVVAGQLSQEVQDAGRNTIWDTGQKDSRRVGWMRTTGPDCCAFCAMLASRSGGVYQSEAGTLWKGGIAGGEDRKYHPNCNCGAEPVFIDNPVYSEREQFFQDLWKSKIKDKYFGSDALPEWRREVREAYRLGIVPTHEIFKAASR